MINHQVTLAFSDIYGHDPELQLESLFEGTTLDYASSLIEIMNANEQVYNGTRKLIDYLRTNWFSQANAQFYLDMEARILAIARRFPHAEMVIFNPPSSLSFLEYLLKYLQAYPEPPQERPSNAQMERNLLDAYLIINQQSNRANNGIKEIEDNFPDEVLPWLNLYKPFQYADLINRDLRELYLIEIYKGVLFFEFLENDKDTDKILQAFLHKYGCAEWLQYLKAASGLPANAIDTANAKGNNFIELDPALPFYDTCIRILDAIEVPLEAVALQEDYLFLRNHPIFRTGEAKFQVIYKRFLIEKIFRALYFEISKLGHDLKIMHRDKFRSMVYTSGYSEQHILYRVLDRIFENAQIRLHGNVMEKADPAFGASDYLCYQDGNIFLFESKDILVRKEVKERLFIPELRIELRKKFYKDNDGDKAVLQLAKNAKKLLEGDYQKFGFVHGKFRQIYPVIVVHSDAFTVMGINQLLRQWFGEACTEAGISKKDRFRVRPVVLIDSNTLLSLQDRIGKKHTRLEQLIDGYLEQTDLRHNVQKKAGSVVEYESKYLIPFAHYVERAIKSIKGVVAPRAMREKIRDVLMSGELPNED